MFSPDQKQIISKYKTFYKSIVRIKCPYFNNEYVFFNMKGFDHLLRKGGKTRPFYDQLKRLTLLVYCKQILAGEYTYVKFRFVTKEGGFACFWAFSNTSVNGLKMRLIVRQINNRQKHFFSIFPIKH